ncbi:hypothetical protein M3B38_00430 [Dietzia cinnamea]|uniref:FAD-binding protein n=1 Tax=Dietzia TaxID=37914 RepID=UPI0020C2D330|nr:MULTISPECIES: FAD-binding protein [Dietzia]MCT1710458.1 hypothetical protein [Dietzia cinnamea]MCT2263698.1 hypothetical protein [Dietzia cinnamea]
MSTRIDDLRDVVVVGGAAAGLSAGLTLARARRGVTVIDAGRPRNAPAEGIHGLLALDGVEPSEYLARGRAEVERYDGEVVDGEVVDTRPAGTVSTSSWPTGRCCPLARSSSRSG